MSSHTAVAMYELGAEKEEVRGAESGLMVFGEGRPPLLWGLHPCRGKGVATKFEGGKVVVGFIVFSHQAAGLALLVRAS